MSETVEQLLSLVKDANQKLKEMLEIKDKMLNMTKDLDNEQLNEVVESNAELLLLSEEFKILTEKLDL